MQIKILLNIISFMVLLLVIGCSPYREAYNIEGVTGIILEIEDDSILIQGNNSKVELKCTKDTVYKGKNRNELVIGDRVRTWYSKQPLDSDPMQATASKIKYGK